MKGTQKKTKMDGNYECKILSPSEWKTENRYLEAGRVSETNLKAVIHNSPLSNLQFHFQQVASTYPSYPYFYIQMTDAFNVPYYLKYNSSLNTIDWSGISEPNDAFLFSLEPSETIEDGYHLLIRTDRDRILIGNTSTNELSVASVPTQLVEGWEIVTIQLQKVNEPSSTSTPAWQVFLVIFAGVIGFVALFYGLWWYTTVYRPVREAAEAQVQGQAQAQTQDQAALTPQQRLALQQQQTQRNDRFDMNRLAKRNLNQLVHPHFGDAFFNQNRRLAQIYHRF